jgi:uncharacterized protein YcaQ
VARDGLSLSEARRIALAAQGFDRARPTGRVGASHLRRIVRQLGLLQIDYVNVLVPAQYLVPFSRLGPYNPAHLDALVYRTREFTEQWAREASIVPIERWPLVRHRMDTHDRRWRALTAFLDRHAVYADWVLNEIRTRGPMTAGDVPEPDGSRGKRADFWGWTLAKCALEGHFARGTLGIADRKNPGAARVYDLAERVIPATQYERVVDRTEAKRELLRLAAQAHGIGTIDDLADYYRIPLREAKRHIADLVTSGDVREVHVEGWREPAYLHRDAALPRRLIAAALLSPFDPVVWYRPRVARLFEFAYLLEIWVPAAKRRWGYYVLPFLCGERLVARVDLKADRTARRLLVLAAYCESHADRETVARALGVELRAVATWLNLLDVSVERRGNFARALAAALKAGN